MKWANEQDSRLHTLIRVQQKQLPTVERRRCRAAISLNFPISLPEDGTQSRFLYQLRPCQVLVLLMQANLKKREPINRKRVHDLGGCV